MATRGDLLAECAQQLRASNFDFEVLLGASVSSVWQALGRLVARQLAQHKGVSIQQLGKFGFYKAQTSTSCATPVFLLADRFASTYGVAWRNRQLPAPLTVTAELSMAALGNDASLGHDQTRRTLDAILNFIGKKLQRGEATGRLVLPGVGSFIFDGKALSFSFDPSMLRSLAIQGQADKPSPPSAVFRKSVTGDAIDSSRRRVLVLDASCTHTETSTLQRSVSVDSALQPLAQSKLQHKALFHFDSPRDNDLAPLRHQSRRHDGNEKFVGDDDKIKKKHRHRRHRREVGAVHSDPYSKPDPMPLNGRQILPRFLIPEPREMFNARPPSDQVMQAAYQREIANLEQAKRMDEEHSQMLAVRQRAVQQNDLQVKAEQAVARRELNAFLNNQIKEKRQQKAASAGHNCYSYGDIKILPLELGISDEIRRLEKQKLNQRLNEQVAAKVALKKDRRALDQAESAYYISKLMLQDESERQEMAERKRVEKETMLAGWSQQKAIQAQKKALKVHLK